LRIGAKARLHTGEVVVCGAKGFQGYLQLIAFGPVLGVVNHGVHASSKRKRDVQGLRFRIWFAGRDGNDRDWNAMLPRSDRRTGVVVVGLRRNNHIQFFNRVIQPLDCR
jgi:hypothetical protein